MSDPLNILMIEGNPAALNDKWRARGVPRNGESYGQVLLDLDADIQVTHCMAADADTSLPDGVGLGDFDGAVLGGSALRAMDGSNQPEVRRQIDLVKSIISAGLPFFGSCWGLQVAAVAAGGTVQANPRGREVGIARNLAVTSAGRGHGLFQDKPDVFSSPCIHYDEVTHLPADATVLASNGHSTVQAAVIREGGADIWGVQYHPEFDLERLTELYTFYGDDLIEQGFFGSWAELNAYVDDLKVLIADPRRADLAWRYGIDTDILDSRRRRREIANWLAHVRSRRR